MFKWVIQYFEEDILDKNEEHTGVKIYTREKIGELSQSSCPNGIKKRRTDFLICSIKLNQLVWGELIDKAQWLFHN